MKTGKRKLRHLEVCLNEDVDSDRPNGFERYDLVHTALPETDMDSIDLSVKFLGKKFAVPLFIEPMTGGTAEAEKINKNLAKAAQDLGVGMGVGSQRAMIEDSGSVSTFFVRDVAPGIFLAGNIGAAQIKEFGSEKILNALKEINADALCVHLNPAQEMAQKNGNKRWRGVLSAIRELCSDIKMPVVAKEVGCGISGTVAKSLESAGVSAIDVAGLGGTSWVKVDTIITKKPLEKFFSWGIPTAECVEQCRRSVKVPVIASGGIRNGIEAAKALSMGADLVGLALPLLKPATKSAGSVKSVLTQIIMELRACMFLSGSVNIDGIKGKHVRAWQDLR